MSLAITAGLSMYRYAQIFEIYRFVSYNSTKPFITMLFNHTKRVRCDHPPIMGQDLMLTSLGYTNNTETSVYKFC